MYVCVHDVCCMCVCAWYVCMCMLYIKVESSGLSIGSLPFLQFPKHSYSPPWIKGSKICISSSWNGNLLATVNQWVLALENRESSSTRMCSVLRNHPLSSHVRNMGIFNPHLPVMLSAFCLKGSQLSPVMLHFVHWCKCVCVSAKESHGASDSIAHEFDCSVFLLY